MQKEEKISVFKNPFLLSGEQLKTFVTENQGDIIGKTLVNWHNFAIVSKKTKSPRLLIFQRKEKAHRDERLQLISALFEEGWRETCLWTMGAIKLQICAKSNNHSVHFTMLEEENLSPALIQVFTPFISELTRLLVPHLGDKVELNFHFSNIEDTHHAYRVKVLPKQY